MNKKSGRPWRLAGGILLVSLLGAGTAIFFTVRRHIPPELGKDIRAGLAARNLADPDERLRTYLERRYGPLSDPANRREVFLDYFNPDHIKALYLMVTHSPENQRRSNVQAAARWLDHYRTSMTAEERAALRTRLQTPEGRAMLSRATSQYNAQDVQYRGLTAPVISQLLQTIGSLQNP